MDTGTVWVNWPHAFSFLFDAIIPTYVRHEEVSRVRETMQRPDSGYFERRELISKADLPYGGEGFRLYRAHTEEFVDTIRSRDGKYYIRTVMFGNDKIYVAPSRQLHCGARDQFNLALNQLCID